MSISRNASGTYRAQLYVDGKNVSVPGILRDGRTSYRTRTEAKQARAKAREVLGRSPASGVTVKSFWERWTTDPLFARPKQSTNKHNRERTKAFVDRYGSLRLDRVSDQEVSEWLAGGRRTGTVPALRAMFNDARSAKGGRLVAVNPFAELGLSRSKGNAGRQPPDESVIWALINAAKALCPPGFAGWLQTACWTGMRPAELDALRWDAVDFDGGWVDVREQMGRGGTSSPKNNDRRNAILTQQAREALLAQPREADWCFVNNERRHWTPGARAYWWAQVRAKTDYRGSLYLASRHFFGAYAVNVLGLDSEDVAIALGHKDGGALVRSLYGHRRDDLALERVARAFEGRSNVRPLREADSA